MVRITEDTYPFRANLPTSINRYTRIRLIGMLFRRYGFDDSTFSIQYGVVFLRSSRVLLLYMLAFQAAEHFLGEL